MIFRTAVSAVAAFALCAGLAFAATTPSPQPSPTLNPQPQGTEVAFVTGIQKDLMARFPTAADAVKAGYFRYTNEDSTGAISYANLQWQSADPQHPSQLWYDVNGNLLGADFSVLQSDSMAPPKLWGVDFGRWESFREHIHFVLTGPNGTETYGGMSAKKFVAAGGSVTDPGAAALVKAGKATSIAEVKRVFLFPSLWDLIVWVKPNPDGAFAEKNPAVTPSAAAKKDD
jgi:hypothetical protein